VKAKTELMASWPEAKQFGETVARWRKISDFFRGAPACIVVLMGRYSSVADQILQARGETIPLPGKSANTARSSLLLQTVAAASTYICYSFIISDWPPPGCRADSGQEGDRGASERAAGVGFRKCDSGGYPAETPELRPRKPIQEVIRFFR